MSEDIQNPTNILEIRKNVSNNTSKSQYYLKLNVLNKILEPIKEYEIAIISIVGPSRKGKSFILNYMSRYLSDHNNNDWIGNKSDALKGFEWKTDIEPQTSGIWLSQPYLKERSDGKKIAIMLMDTQGVFDQYSNERDWSTIVGISLLISSCLIFNVTQDLQENIMSSLKTYLQYGLLAAKAQNKEQEKKPFQKLFFLIRDWNMPSQCPFGLKGGEDYLKKKLEIKESQDENAKRARQLLLTSFNDIECFLMPQIGEMAEADNFNGCLEQLHPRFVHNMQILISHLLNPEEIELKHIKNKIITCDQLIQYFNSYIEIFNGDDLPSPETINTATEKVAYRIKLNKIEVKHLKMLKKLIGETMFIPEKVLEKENKEIQRELIEKIENSPFFNESEEKRTDQKFNDNYKKIVEINVNRRNFIISKCLAKCGLQYKETLTKAIGTEVMDPFDLEMLFQNSRINVFETFREKFCGEEEDVFTKEKLMLTEKLSKLDMEFREHNNNLKRKTNALYSQILEKSIEFYSKHFDKEMSENKILDQNVFKQFRKELKRNTLQFFRQQTEKNGLKYDLNFESKLEQKIKQINDNFKERFKQNYETTVKQMNEKLDIAVHTYYKNISDFMDGLTSITVLKRKHKQFESQAFNQFIQSCNTSDENFLQPFKQQFYQKVNQLFEDLMIAEKQKTEEMRSRYESKANSIKNNYIKEMEQLITNKMIISEDELKKYHKKSRTEALKMYKEFFNSVDEGDSLLSKFSSDLKESINDEFERLIELNTCKRDEYIFEEKTNELFDFYENCINQRRDTLKTVPSLTQLNEELLSRIVTEFKSIKSISGKIDSQKYLINLKDRINTLFSSMVSDLEESNRKVNKFEAIVSEILENYESKMRMLFKDNKYYSDQSLENFHRKYKRDSITKFSAQFESEQSSDHIFIQKYKDNTERMIGDKFEKYAQDNKCKREETNRIIGDRIKNYLKLYEFDMNESFQFAESEEVLLTYHQKFETKYSNLLRNQNSINDPTLYSNYLSSLKEELNFYFNTIRAKYNSNDIKNRIIEATNKYKKQMQKIINSEDSHSNSSLYDYHEQFKNHSVLFLESKLCENNLTNIGKYISDLSLNIDSEFEKIRQDFEGKQTVIKKYLEISVETLSLEFHKTLNKSMPSFEGESDLKEYQQTLKRKMIDEFIASNNTTENSVKNIFRKQLELKIDKSIEESMDIWKIHAINIERMIKHLRFNVRNMYSNEMDKYIKSAPYLLNDKLDNCNELVLKLISDRFNSDKGNMTDEKYMKFIRESVEDIYKKKRDENAMRIPVTPAIGIDLGTTNSCVAIFKKDKVVIIPNELNRSTTPSYISLRDNEEVVGDLAKEEMFGHIRNTIYSAKRLIGREISDPSIQKYINLMSYEVKNDGFNNPKISVKVNRCDKTYFPEEISSILLKKLKKNAENFLRTPVTKAVITVPAYFNDAQKDATKYAGKLAGLEVLKIINEPTASAIAYSLNQIDDATIRNVLIYDFGGGTFDVAVLEVNKGNINVKAVGGDNNLGGDDFDNNIMEYCLQKFTDSTGLDLVDKDERERAICRLRQECEKSKCKLTSIETTNILIQNFYEDNHLNVMLTRKQFEEINFELMERSMNLVDKVLDDSNVTHSDINDIVLVGGTTLIPKLQEMLSQKFNGRALNHYLDPYEVVARGAAIQAAILNGQRADELDLITFSDVTPMSLGIEIGEDMMDVIIPRNSKVPCLYTHKYQTSNDFETQIIIKVFEGESEVVSQNHQLGSFVLSGIPPAHKGEHVLNVTFTVNDEGLLNVSAKIDGMGVENAIQIEKYRGRAND